ncbi:MAG: hypothetical protein H6850_02005 [Alphaproteobacteria bacterium]|nr:MAG: hypothetical protein H6850_02005 [Alphaproteobacteria bacterium]
MKALLCPCGTVSFQDVLDFLAAAPQCIDMCPVTVCTTVAELKCLDKIKPCILHAIQGSNIQIMGLYTCEDEDCLKVIEMKYGFFLDLCNAEKVRVLRPCPPHPVCEDSCESECDPFSLTPEEWECENLGTWKDGYNGFISDSAEGGWDLRFDEHPRVSLRDKGHIDGHASLAMTSSKLSSRGVQYESSSRGAPYGSSSRGAKRRGDPAMEDNASITITKSKKFESDGWTDIEQNYEADEGEVYENKWEACFDEHPCAASSHDEGCMDGHATLAMTSSKPSSRGVYDKPSSRGAQYESSSRGAKRRGDPAMDGHATLAMTDSKCADQGEWQDVCEDYADDCAYVEDKPCEVSCETLCKPDPCVNEKKTSVWVQATSYSCKDPCGWSKESAWDPEFM